MTDEPIFTSVGQALPTADRVRHLFDFDAAAGLLRWRVSQSSRARVGAVAGHVRPDGRRAVTVDGVQYLAYRVIWLHVHGVWPTLVIDHIDGDCGNDRIDNLRDVPTQINAENRRRPRADKRAGNSLGAYPSDGGRWLAQIVVKGRSVHLGCFDTEAQAHQKYLEAKREHHAGCTI